MKISVENLKQAAGNVSVAVFTVLIVLCLLTTVITFFGNLYFLIDNVSNMRYQLFISSLVLLLISIVFFVANKQSLWILIVCSISLMLNFAEVYPYISLNNNPVDKSDKGVKLLLSNILTSNEQYDSVLQLVNREQPDIAVIQEVNFKWVEELKDMRETYKYGIDGPRTDNFGMSVYSKIPLENIKLQHLRDKDYFIPYITFKTEIEGREVNFLLIHTLPPLKGFGFIARNKQFEFIAAMVKESKNPFVVIGDLNSTPFTYYYKKMAKEADLTDSRRGHGFWPSWSTRFPSFDRIPIDLILHTKELKTTFIKTCEEVGSDHLPVVARLVVKYN